jgi:two-component system chemotaxis response regulator CheB
MDTPVARPLRRLAATAEGHDLVVVGASAGGIDAITTLLAGLPADLPLAILVVLHVSPDSASLLPGIVGRASALPVRAAEDGLPLVMGEVCVAVPDRHLLVEPGTIRVVRGPRENRFRPAIDPLFRSAAWAYGSRVIGVLLSGMLDDGTAGLWAIKTCGGVTIVQDPQDARFGEMPRNAIAQLPIDHCVSASQLGMLVDAVVRQPPRGTTAPAAAEQLGVETKMALRSEEGDIARMNRIGKLSPYTCPACHGSLWEVYDEHVLRFRCHTGHGFSAESLDAEHRDEYENALFGALRALEENARLAQTIARRSRAHGRDAIAQIYEDKAADDDHSAEVIRAMLDGIERAPSET